MGSTTPKTVVVPVPISVLVPETWVVETLGELPLKSVVVALISLTWIINKDNTR